MKASDLRIGNLVYNNFHEENQVADHNIIRWLELNQNPEDFDPIPLTEEWLIKFGLIAKPIKYDYTTLFTFAEEFSCYFDTRYEEKISIEEYGEGAFPLKHIKYVHQLQNLYYALTGEELIIKE